MLPHFKIPNSIKPLLNYVFLVFLEKNKPNVED